MNTDQMQWQAVFFDFDGVIAASTEVKVRAFTTLFAPYGPTVQNAVVRYHLANGGLPRREKLRHCLETIAGESTNDQQLDRMGQAFADLVVDEVVAAPLITGAMSTLQQLRASSVPAFVVSGTPEDEMQLIVARKGLQSLFAGVHGSPRPKTEIILDILGRFSFTPGHCLFIGDALADYRAARETGLHFLGIVPNGQPSIFPEKVATSSTVTLEWPKKGTRPPRT
ncbi:HAD family hydrolase [Desulfobulbus alkaliphilus]|uniref:HAD family hydrolase n=1 Tax=Desulfobulbus alkaliphilus TaxID=869814 RepID=UPI001962C769|nr:HAD hydrolase-like protein [Desulfobulbus alkaliphilus]MBM9535834.1 HAD family hydrolase [Desulfobulbus alkaliphilus]